MLGSSVRTGSLASSARCGGSDGGVVVVGATVVVGLVVVAATVVVVAPAPTARGVEPSSPATTRATAAAAMATARPPRRPHPMATGCRRAHPAETVPDHSTATKAPKPAGSSSALASTPRLRIATERRSGAAAAGGPEPITLGYQVIDPPPLQELRLRVDGVGLWKLIESELDRDVLTAGIGQDSDHRARGRGTCAATHATDARRATTSSAASSRRRAAGPVSAATGRRSPTRRRRRGGAPASRAPVLAAGLRAADRTAPTGPRRRRRRRRRRTPRATLRRTRRAGTGRLSSNSLAMTTPSNGPSGRSGRDSTASGWSARCAADSSTATYRIAARHAGRAA